MTACQHMLTFKQLRQLPVPQSDISSDVKIFLWN